MDDCVFCEIVAGRAEASVVYEDDIAVAFLDIRPVNPGHLLVVPKRHAAALADVDLELGGHLFRVALPMQRAIRRSGVRCDGINLFLADGEAAGQEVFHVHLHVFPRFAGDAVRIEGDWSVRPSRAELDAVAAKIRGAHAAGPSGVGKGDAAP